MNGSIRSACSPNGSTDGSSAERVPSSGGGFDLLAIDLDGTLLRTDKTIGPNVLRAVSRVIDDGVTVVLASARPPRSVRRIYEVLGLETWQINYNGALIHRRGRNDLHQPLSADLARRVVKLARRVDPDVVVSIEILDKWYTDHFDESLPTETSIDFAPDFVGPLEAFLHVPVTKIMLLAPPNRLDPVSASVALTFGHKIKLLTSDPHLVQIAHPQVDKSTALAELAARYEVDQQRVLAIGDAPNDLGMLKWAGMGVAVENAWPVVRKAADVIVSSNDEDGVAEVIDRFCLGGKRGV